MTTPPLKIGASGSGSPGTPSVTAERLVSSSGSVELPLLTKANYHEWSLVMQVSLEALGLWGAVESISADRREDRLALAAILRAVPADLKAGLAVKKSAKEAWDAVKRMRMGDMHVKEANAQLLLMQYETIVFGDGESVDEFIVRITGLVGNQRELGERIEESRMVKKILRVLPSRYNQVACSMEMLLDLNKMTVEELVGRLRVAEDRCGAEAAADRFEHLLLTEEQWEARRHQRGKERAHGGDGQRGGGEKGGGRSDNHNTDDDSNNSTSGIIRRGRSRYRGRCVDCGERGHMARDCRAKKKEKALLADVDDEPTLL